MKHRYSCAKLAAAALLMTSALAASAEPRSVYIVGADAPNGFPFWETPCTDNKEDFETQKLSETADGSNIYVGTFTLWNTEVNPFRFYTDLYDSSQDPDNTLAWHSNVISPALDKKSSYGEIGSDRLVQKGTSGVFTSSGVFTKLCPGMTPSGWLFPGVFNGTYRIILDLNNLKDVKVTLVPDDKYYVVREDQPTPSVATITDYSPATSPDFIGYFEPGTLNFSLYNLAQGLWQNPLPDFTMQYGSQERLQGSESANRAAYTLADWPGGVLQLYPYWMGGCSYNLLPDKPVTVPLSTTVATLIGNFCSWDFSQAPVMNFAAPTSRFVMELPVGAEEWKLALGADWDAPNFGIDEIIKNDDGSFTVLLERYGQNIAFDVPLSEPLNVTIDLDKLTATLPAGAPLTATTESAPDGSYPDDVDELLVELRDWGVAPWKGASQSVMGTVTHLHKQADGTYKNGMSLDRPFRFISKRAPKGEAYEVISPSLSDRIFTLPEDTGTSSAIRTSSTDGGFWTVPSDLVGLHVDVTVDTSGDTPKVTFYCEGRGQAQPLAPIYLVGSIQGWDIDSPACELRATDKGGYYGSFPVSADCTDNLIFRFYTTLGNWGGDSVLPSFGSNPMDGFNEEIELTDGRYSGAGTPGKGAWIITNWKTGDTLYAYVNISSRQVIFSNQPIPEAGEYITEAPERDDMWIYDEANGSTTRLEKVDDNTFVGEISVSNLTPYKFRLFSQPQTMARDEADWGTNGALVAAGAPVGPDNLGISEASLNECTSATTPEPISVNLNPDGTTYYYVTYCRNEGKVYFEKQAPARYYLTGAIADGKELTYANRAEWAALTVPFIGGIIDIPAGKFDFTLRQRIAPTADNRRPVDATDVIWNSESMMTFPGANIADKHLRCDSWNGGKVGINSCAVADLTDISQISATFYTQAYRNSSTVNLSATAPGIFSGKLPFADANSSARITFTLKHLVDVPLGDYANYDFLLTSVTYDDYWDGYTFNPDEDVILSSGGTYSAPLGVNGYAFILPALTGDGELDITVDLNTMTMTAVNSATEAPVYEAVAADGLPLDGTLIVPSTEKPGAMVLPTSEVTAPASDVAPIEFNFARPDGSVLVPEGGSQLADFDKDGIYVGRIATVGTARTTSRTALRQAASATSKWQIELPEGAGSTTLHALIDETAGKIVIYSSAHNTDRYYISYWNMGEQKGSYASLADVDAARESSLVKQPSGLYTGSLTVDGNQHNVMFHTIPDGQNSGSGISTPAYNSAMQIFHLEDESEVSRPAVAGYSGFWAVTAPAGRINVVFDPEECTLTMTHSSASTEDVSAEAAGSLSVKPGDGCIEVYAPEATVIAVHNISGALIKRVSAPAGRSAIPLAPGFYTAAGQKLLVK